jgi:hypothetical protein
VQKDKMDLFIRTIGTARATTKIGLANLTPPRRAFQPSAVGIHMAETLSP